MERRNFVIGLGGIAASAGLIAGSGAFSQISADRNMTVTVADDADAYMSLALGDGSGPYATTNGGNVELDFGAVTGNATGVNDNAISSFDSVIEVGNNSDSEVTLGYTIEDSSETEVTEGISLYTGSADGDPVDLDTQTLTAFDTTEQAAQTLQFGVKIDTTTLTGTDTITDETYTVTISASQV